MTTTLDLRSAFGTDDPAEVVTRTELLKQALADAPDSTKGFVPNLPSFPQPQTSPAQQALAALNNPDIAKAVSPEVMQSLQSQLGAMPDLAKDLTLTSPLSTGYVAYDLEAPAKLLTPRPTPLRNRIPRGKGIGTAHRYKRITGFTGTGTGGVGLQRPGITSATSTSFGPASYNRGPKISYAGDEAAVNYLEFSLSDSVTWSAQFSGQGFQDIRQLSRTSLLYSSMLMEERMLLGGRGTGTGFAGALSTPAAPTLTVRNANAGETGNTANIANLYVYVTAATIFGETVSGTQTTTGMSAATGKVVDVQVANVAGAFGYKVYAGTTNAAANVFPAALTIAGASSTVQATVSGNQVSTLAVASGAAGSVTINFTGGGTGGAPSTGSNPPTAATDSSAVEYDGILTIAAGANSGYTKALNSTFSSNPGDEFNVAFAEMYDAVKADPDEVLFNGIDRKQLSDLIKLNSNSSAYRLALTQAEAHSATIGSMVTGLQNEVTGKMVDLTVHPWMPQGNCPILSWTLPIPDTQVSDCWKAWNVQDYMAVEWPVLQFSYDASTYWYGTFICYAPAWQGLISNIVKK